MDWLWLLAPFVPIVLLAACDSGDDDSDEILP